MQAFVRTAILTCVFFVAGATAALADEAKTFAVLPFQTNGPVAYTYLEKAIPQMLTSRLYWKDHFVAVDSAAYEGVSAPSSNDAAKAAVKKVGVDYLVYGSVTIVGDQSSVDLRVASANGTVWPRSASSKVDQMIPTLEEMADAVNAEVFKREVAPAVAEQPTMTSEYQITPVLEMDSRSNSLSIPAHGMAVEDVNGDGRNEIVLLTEHEVFVYSYENARMELLASYKGPMRLSLIAVRVADLDRDGTPEIIVSAVDTDQTPNSFILNFRDGGLRVTEERIRYLLNVVRMPPEFMPVLIGQTLARGNDMWREPVYEMVKMGGGYDKGIRLTLPEKANLFNFVWIPASEKEGAKIVILEPSGERLRVFTEQFARLAETAESYSGATAALEQDQSLEVMGKDSVLMGSNYYIPMPMLVVDLDRNGRYELVVNRPISVAAQFFERYRFFPQGEIHSLFWDGLGLTLDWKTRRIKGSVVAYDIKDMDGSGEPKLVVCVNTHPGNLGMKARKTMIITFPLSMEKTSPAVPRRVVPEL